MNNTMNLRKFILEFKPFPRIQAGVTLVELMVAMAIGMLVVLAVMAATLATRTTARTQSDLQGIQDNQRFIVDRLTKKIRNAGFQWNPEPLANNAFFAPRDLFLPSPAQANCLSGTASDARHAICGLNDLATGGPVSDRLILRYDGMSANNAPANADGTVTTCANVAVPATNPLDPVEETYDVAWIAGQPVLQCTVVLPAGGGTITVPLISGVESMQILYGYQAAPLNLAANLNQEDSRIVSWGPIVPANAVAIVGVKISLLTRSANQTAAQLDSNTYTFFDSSYNFAAAGDNGAQWTAPGTDRFQRKLISFTAQIAGR